MIPIQVQFEPAVQVDEPQLPEGYPFNQPAFSDAEKKTLRKAGYYFLGKHHHSSVKTCLYTKKAIEGGGMCYKSTFYGIQSHRCIQMTPSTPFCSLLCTFCWRPNSVYEKTWRGGVDSAGEIVEESVYAQRKLLNGLPGYEKTIKARWLERQEPWHVAISLAGEPTMYSQIAELIQHYHAYGMSTFLVTNGSFPTVLQELLDKNAMPTQLYISLSAFDEQSYKKTNVPMIEDYWQRYNESLDFLAKVKNEHRTVLRMTLVNEWNFSHVNEYAVLIKRGQPAYVEVKAFMAVGGARERIGVKGMPLLDQIREFAKQLAEQTGYIYCVEHAPSRVVLLCRDAQAEKNRVIDFRAWAGKFGVELKTGLDEQTNFPKVEKIVQKKKNR